MFHRILSTKFANHQPSSPSSLPSTAVRPINLATGQQRPHRHPLELYLQQTPTEGRIYGIISTSIISSSNSPATTDHRPEQDNNGCRSWQRQR